MVDQAAYIRQSGRGSEDIGINHGGLYAAVAELVLEPVFIILPFSGWPTGKWQRWVMSDGRCHAESWSAAEGGADVICWKADHQSAPSVRLSSE